MKYPGIFAALVAASLALPGHAADGDLWDFLPPLPPTSEVGINLGIDGAGGWSPQLAATLEGPYASRWFGTLGESRTSANDDALTSQYRNLGFVTAPFADLSVGASYEIEDNDGALDIEGYGVSVRFNANHFSLTLAPRWRNISLKLNPKQAAKRSAPELKSRDLSLAADWYASERWSFGIGYSHSSYSEDLSRLASDRRVLLLFTPETLRLSAGLQQQRLTASAIRYIDSGSVGLEWSRSVSAIDDSTTSSATLFVSHAPSRSWRIDASAGIEYADYRDDAIVFGSVGLAFLW